MIRPWTKDDYITPRWFLDMVKAVLGERVVDQTGDNPWLWLNNHPFLASKTGLEPGWSPKNFWNPPYSNIAPWVSRALYEYSVNMCSSIGLLPANTDTRWFHELAGTAKLLMWRGRIKFLKPERRWLSLMGGELWEDVLVEDPSPRHLPMVAFLSHSEEEHSKFQEVFGHSGTILMRRG